MITVEVARGGPLIGIERRVAVATHEAEPHILRDLAIEAGEEAASRTIDGRGIAVAVEITPGAEALPPEAAAPVQGSAEIGIGDRRDGEIAGGRPVEPAENGFAQIAAFLEQHAFDRSVDFARQQIEGLPRVTGAELQHGIVDRIGGIERLQRL
jgi:hypothetical protein